MLTRKLPRRLEARGPKRVAKILDQVHTNMTGASLEYGAGMYSQGYADGFDAGRTSMHMELSALDGSIK